MRAGNERNHTMTEIEALRREVAELREEVARLKASTYTTNPVTGAPPAWPLQTFRGRAQPIWPRLNTAADVPEPQGHSTC